MGTTNISNGGNLSNDTFTLVSVDIDTHGVRNARYDVCNTDIGGNMMETEKRKAYRHNYYVKHKTDMQKYARDHYWSHREAALDCVMRWHLEHPNYQREYEQQRKAIVDDLTFAFYDNGYGTMNEYIAYLRAEAVSERHIHYFIMAMRKYEEAKEACAT